MPLLFRLVSAYQNKVVQTSFFSDIGHIPDMLKYRDLDASVIMKTELPYLYYEDKSRNLSSVYDILKLQQPTWLQSDTTNVRKSTQNNYVMEAQQNIEQVMSARSSAVSDESIPSFREFAMYAAVLVLRCRDNIECNHKLDEHIIPYSLNCNPCLLPFDLIMKVKYHLW